MDNTFKKFYEYTRASSISDNAVFLVHDPVLGDVNITKADLLAVVMPRVLNSQAEEDALIAQGFTGLVVRRDLNALLGTGTTTTPAPGTTTTPAPGTTTTTAAGTTSTTTTAAGTTSTTTTAAGSTTTTTPAPTTTTTAAGTTTTTTPAGSTTTTTTPAPTTTTTTTPAPIVVWTGTDGFNNSDFNTLAFVKHTTTNATITETTSLSIYSPNALDTGWLAIKDAVPSNANMIYTQKFRVHTLVVQGSTPYFMRLGQAPADVDFSTTWFTDICLWVRPQSIQGTTFIVEGQNSTGGTVVYGSGGVFDLDTDYFTVLTITPTSVKLDVLASDGTTVLATSGTLARTVLHNNGMPYYVFGYDISWGGVSAQVESFTITQNGSTTTSTAAPTTTTTTAPTTTTTTTTAAPTTTTTTTAAGSTTTTTAAGSTTTTTAAGSTTTTTAAGSTTTTTAAGSTTTTTTTTGAPGFTLTFGGSAGAWSPPAGVTSNVSGGGSLELDGSGSLIISSPNDTDTAYFEKTGVLVNVSRTYELTFKVPNMVNPMAIMAMRILSDLGSISPVVLCDTGSFANPKFFIMVSTDGSTVQYEDASGNFNQGSQNGAYEPTLTEGNYYTLRLVCNGTTVTPALYNATFNGTTVTVGSLVKQYAGVAASALTGTRILQVGDVWAGSYYGSLLIQKYSES